MARHKNMNWNLSDNIDTNVATLALLMDIRDELKQLNTQILRMYSVSSDVSRINRRLQKHMPLPKGRHRA